MKLLSVLLAAALTGCARSTVAVLVPRLDLDVRVTQTLADAASLRNSGRNHVVLGAWLRWEPRVTDRTAGSELPLGASITPCEVDDAACLTEHAESEPDIAALRVGAP